MLKELKAGLVCSNKKEVPKMLSGDRQKLAQVGANSLGLGIGIPTCKGFTEGRSTEKPRAHILTPYRSLFKKGFSLLNV